MDTDIIHPQDIALFPILFHASASCKQSAVPEASDSIGETVLANCVAQPKFGGVVGQKGHLRSDCQGIPLAEAQCRRRLGAITSELY